MEKEKFDTFADFFEENNDEMYNAIRLEVFEEFIADIASDSKLRRIFPQVIVENQVVSEFIHPNCVIFAHLTCLFSLDSAKTYYELIEQICSCEFNKFEDFIFVLDLVIKNYFGYDGSEANRSKVYDSFSGVQSIEKFKGNNSAKCMEKSALVHNLLKIFGINSYLVSGELGLANEYSKNTSGHVFIVIEDDGIFYLYDPHNSVKVIDSNEPDKSKSAYTGMALFKIGSDINNIEKLTFSPSKDAIISAISSDVLVSSSQVWEYTFPKVSGKEFVK